MPNYNDYNDVIVYKNKRKPSTSDEGEQHIIARGENE